MLQNLCIIFRYQAYRQPQSQLPIGQYKSPIYVVPVTPDAQVGPYFVPTVDRYLPENSPRDVVSVEPNSCYPYQYYHYPYNSYGRYYYDADKPMQTVGHAGKRQAFEKTISSKITQPALKVPSSNRERDVSKYVNHQKRAAEDGRLVLCFILSSQLTSTRFLTAKY